MLTAGFAGSRRCEALRDLNSDRGLGLGCGMSPSRSSVAGCVLVHTSWFGVFFQLGIAILAAEQGDHRETFLRGHLAAPWPSGRVDAVSILPKLSTAPTVFRLRTCVWKLYRRAFGVETPQ